ncbi:mitochondrial import inner membrane translocase subunit tim54 [Savitreella phatthalungensis]
MPGATSTTASAKQGISQRPAPVPEGNPAFNMMGIPKSLRTWKLPSRNWLIFWGVVGSFVGGIGYDRWEKRRVFKRYTSLVSHLADAPLGPLEMPRRVRVLLCAPPGDTIHEAREHFHEYVKPVLNAAAVDFELVEGRMQGDIRHKIAQAIRDNRRGTDNLTDMQRQSRAAVTDHDKTDGDIVVGRHTYKEYIRGVHEGLLGPVEEPSFVHEVMNPRMPGDPVVDAPLEPEAEGEAEGERASAASVTASESTPAKSEEELKKEIEAIKKKIPSSPPSYIPTDEYPSAEVHLPGNADDALHKLAFVPTWDLLGFLNTPWRVARFMTRRVLAEETCSATAGAVLALAVRDFDPQVDPHINEEASKDWPKSIRNNLVGPWMEEVTIDSRVIQHVKVYEPVYAPREVPEKKQQKEEYTEEEEAKQKVKEVARQKTG